MGSPAGIQQHIAETHMNKPEAVAVVRRMVVKLMDEEGITMMEASGALHHVLHLQGQVEGFDPHDPHVDSPTASV